MLEMDAESTNLYGFGRAVGQVIDLSGNLRRQVKLISGIGTGWLNTPAMLTGNRLCNLIRNGSQGSL